MINVLINLLAVESFLGLVNIMDSVGLQYKNIIENIPLLVCCFDSNFNITYINSTYCSVFQIAKADYLNKSFIELIPEKERPTVIKNIKQLSLNNPEITHLHRVLLPKGKLAWQKWTNKAVFNKKGSFVEYQAVGEDITDKKQIEKNILEGELRYRELYMNSPLAYQSLDEDGKFIEVNSSLSRMLGYEQNELIGKWFGDFLTLEYRGKFSKGFSWFMRNGEVNDTPLDIISKSGEIYSVELSGRISHDTKGEFKQTHCIIRDVTQKKQTEEKILKTQYYLSKAQEIGNIGTWEIDLKTNKIIWTDQNYSIFGVDKKQELDYQFFLSCIYPEDREEVDKKWNEGIKNKKYDVEHRICVNGNIKWIREKGEFIKNKDGLTERAIGFTQDFTEQKLTEIALKKSGEEQRILLKEKDFLLKELYHRTKNNMQVISSMLTLKSSFMNNPEVQDVFVEIKNRIMTMALVHKKLYQTKNLSELDLRNYLIDLVDLLSRGLNVNSEKIMVETDVDSKLVTIDTAIPCGLIINELFTNSIKHAFKDSSKGEIVINMKKIEDRILLTYRDNGFALSNDFNLYTSANYGLQSVVALVEHQLKGNIELNLENGTEFRICF